MDKVEFLILHSAVDLIPTLREVAEDYDISHSEMAMTAFRLFQKGDILPYTFDGEDEIPGVALTLSEIESHLQGELPVFYGLTPQGGRQWEDVVHPDWNCFFIQRWTSHSPPNEGKNEGQFVSVSRQITEKLLALDCFASAIKHIPGTEIWEVLEPWQAQYWKTLPRGYRVRYKFKENYWYLSEDEDWVESYKQATLWHSKMDKWYSKPVFE